MQIQKKVVARRDEAQDAKANDMREHEKLEGSYGMHAKRGGVNEGECCRGIVNGGRRGEFRLMPEEVHPHPHVR